MINSDFTLYKYFDFLFFLFFVTNLKNVSLESFRIFCDSSLKFDFVFKLYLIDNGDDEY